MASVLLISMKAYADEFSGSFSISVDQRMFNDSRFGDKNGFSEGFIPSIEAVAGFYEFPYQIEPVMSFGFIKNSARACAVLADGVTCDPDAPPSEDKFHYQIYTVGSGVRWKAWTPDLFMIIPYAQAQMTYRYARIRKKSSNGDELDKISGGDFGADLLGGIQVSFMYDRARRKEMQREWGVQDFGLSLHARYLPSGWLKHGLGAVSDTGGWSFGAGLVIDW